MSDKSRRDELNRRRLLQTTGTAVGGSLLLGATGTTAAASDSRTEGGSCVQEISTEGDTVVTLVEVFGEKFLFREAAEHRDADDVSTQSEATTYETTESGYPVEFQKIDSSISASDINSDGSIQVQDRSDKSVQIQGVDFKPGNFIEEYDVDTKQISDTCGDVAFGSHHAIEFHFRGAGAFSTLGVAGLAGVLCYAAAATTAIPTAGVSGALAAGVCSVLTTAVDLAIDVDEIPDSINMSVDLWDQDEQNYLGLNTSPTIAVGIAPGWEVQWHEIPKVGEYDKNIHLGL